MDEQKVPVGPFIYFGTFPIPLHELHLTEEQMNILKRLEPTHTIPEPKRISSFPEDMWLEPDEE